jgi:hypothetical protein
MNKILIWVLTRTTLARTIAATVAGLVVGWLGLTEDQTNLLVSSITMIIVALASHFIETRKAEGVKEIQEDVGAKQDGYAGPETKKAVRKGIHGGRP